MKAALVSAGVVENVVVIGDPEPVPVFVDGVQQFDEDGEPVMRPGPGFVPPEGCELVELADDAPVGPGWRRAEGKWVAPDPDPARPPVSNAQALAELLDERGITAADLAALLQR